MQPLKALGPVSVTEVLSYLNKSTQLILCNYFSLREREGEGDHVRVLWLHGRGNLHPYIWPRINLKNRGMFPIKSTKYEALILYSLSLFEYNYRRIGNLN